MDRRPADLFKRHVTLIAIRHVIATIESAMTPRISQRHRWTRFSARRGQTINIRCRCDTGSYSFNPQPEAQVDRRPADLFKRHVTLIAIRHVIATIESAMTPRISQRHRWTRFSARRGQTINIRCRCDTGSYSFNPQPEAQVDRRPADLFERHVTLIAIRHVLRNDRVSDDASGFSAAPVDALLCEARSND